MLKLAKNKKELRHRRKKSSRKNGGRIFRIRFPNLDLDGDFMLERK
jgi:hypothetical protein